MNGLKVVPHPSPSPSHSLSQAKPQLLKQREALVLPLGMGELMPSLRPVRLVNQKGFAQYLEVCRGQPAIILSPAKGHGPCHSSDMSDKRVPNHSSWPSRHSCSQREATAASESARLLSAA